ncbi:MAG: preprotein translocase subunit SecA [Flavobacteriales bacterium]|nr:preprotein translocase subunit SecA [Flavobacteriales bacterium]
MGTLNKILKKFVGDKAQKDIQEIQPLVDEANKIYATLSGKSTDDIRNMVANLRTRIREHVATVDSEIKELRTQAESSPQLDMEAKEAIYDKVDELVKEMDRQLEEILEQILPEAFALVKETARRFSENSTIRVRATERDREFAMNKEYVTIEGDEAVWNNHWDAAGSEITWNMVHYDVQLVGGVALHRGKVAEMQTGEGKTLVATLPIFLNALTGMGVHVVTVNDYLARRDSEWMGPIFEFHGLTIDCIDKHEPNSNERRKAYHSDITYGTNNAFGFDYLRDNMARAPEHLVQRKHHYAIVDEVDSVLIDEARTPLIISGPTGKTHDQEFDQLRPRIESLYNVQRKAVTEFLTDAKKRLSDGGGKEDTKQGGISLLRAHRGLPKNKALIKFLSSEGMKQQLLKTEGFYMQDNSREMHVIDEELYFTINEKNNQVELTEKGIQFLSRNMEDENFFVMPDLATEMVHIDQTVSDENERLQAKESLQRDYHVKSARIHTINQLLKAFALFEKDVDYVVIENKVKIVDEQTGRIMEGRRYSDGLHQAIEAKENVKVEAATQTHATITLQNYFRMYHKLAGMTGTAETEAGELWEIYKLDVMCIPTNRPIQRLDMEDLVYKTKREKYNAIIDEIERLRNAGRPVLVGTTTVEVSELLSKMLTMKNIAHQVLNAKLHQKEADIVAFAGQAGTVTIATNMAGRGTDIKLGEGVKEAGGLAIIGTERHDSRRVDRQLRGRSGRQGDPGSSQFFVSLEDDLMRLFGSDRISKMMDRLGLQEGEVIQHSMITKSIERAQKKVEENNFGVRKRLLEYDDVMNAQREVIYKRRRHALFGERLKLDIAMMFYDLSENLVQAHQNDKDFDSFRIDMLQKFGIETPFSEEDFRKNQSANLAHTIYLKATEHYTKKSGILAEQAHRVITQVYEDPKNVFNNIQVPFTDGRKTLNVVANLEKCYETQSRELIDSLEKGVVLAIIDQEWKDHLRLMDELRSNVQFASHEQKDPLLIYKFESYELFESMIKHINGEVASFLVKSTLPVQPNQVQQAQAPQRPTSNVQTSKEGVQNIAERASAARQVQQGAAPTGPRPKAQPVRNDAPKVGRNEPCPCGSGKKYKQCHGKM